MCGPPSVWIGHVAKRFQLLVGDVLRIIARRLRGDLTLPHRGSIFRNLHVNLPACVCGMSKSKIKAVLAD